MTNNWFEIWFEDKKSIISTMIRNMTADINAGYDPSGRCIREQLHDIEEYQTRFDDEMKTFRTMEEKKISQWCYYDLKRRGAI